MACLHIPRFPSGLFLGQFRRRQPLRHVKEQPLSYDDITTFDQPVVKDSIVGHSHLDAEIANALLQEDSAFNQHIAGMSATRPIRCPERGSGSNIRTHPSSYARNYVFNFFKMLFSVPGSARVEGA